MVFPVFAVAPEAFWGGIRPKMRQQRMALNLMCYSGTKLEPLALPLVIGKKEQDMKTPVQVKGTRLLFVMSIFALLAAGAGFAFAGQVILEGNVADFVQSPKEASQPIDFAHAKPMPLPQAVAPALGPFEGGISTRNLGTPGSEPGQIGTGKTIPGINAIQSEAEEPVYVHAGGVEPPEFGTKAIPYTTSRVDLTSANNESKSFPYRAAGKLYFNEPDGSYVCSGSLIKRGIIVTAAHCVAKFGTSTFYSGWKFYPGMSYGPAGISAPYGAWSVSNAWVLKGYLNGTDSCETAGITCVDDVAVLAVTPKGGVLPGTAAGWLGYGWDGWGFTSANTTQISQLGYPVSHDNGNMMQRTDSQGYVSSGESNNTVWGSRQSGGSSGGPLVANLGVAAVLSGNTYGTYSSYNYVIGVTSWGYETDQTIKEQGASPFTSGNVVTLVNAACEKYPANCK
jgi:V8-like Glu-specific endopeptidase